MYYNSNNIKIVVNDILDSVIEYYGKEYRNHILKSLKDTLVYEWTNENLGNLLKRYIPQYNDEHINYYNNIQDDVDGLHIHTTNGTLAIIKSQDDKLLFEANLTHEVFGHGVCNYKNYKTRIYDIPYQRDGIMYVDLNTQQSINAELNEGFIEAIAMDIMNVKYKGYNKDEKIYIIGQKVYNEMKKYDNKKELIDIMVNGNKNIENLYNINTPVNEWSILSNAADELNDKVVDECIKTYNKRMEKRI